MLVKLVMIFASVACGSAAGTPPYSPDATIDAATDIPVTESTEVQITPTSTWDRYKPRAMQDILDETEQYLTPENFKADYLVEPSLDYQLPSRVPMIDTGQFRDVPQDHKLVVDSALGGIGRQDIAATYKQEGLFLDRDVSYWIPVQDPLIPFMQKELTPNGSVTLLLLWIGAVVKPDGPERVFIVTEFTK